MPNLIGSDSLSRTYQRKNQSYRLAFSLVPRIGFEPMTLSLEVSCSIQLSYQGVLSVYINSSINLKNRVYLDSVLTWCGWRESCCARKATEVLEINFCALHCLSISRQLATLATRVLYSSTSTNSIRMKPNNICWCGWRESNSRPEFGKLIY